MYIYIYVHILMYTHIYIYGIHHWRILWSSYRKLAWVGFEPTAAEFRSDSLTDWAIRPWVHTWNQNEVNRKEKSALK